MNEKETAPAADTGRTAHQVALDAWSAAERSAAELDTKAKIARRAANQAQRMAELAKEAEVAGQADKAREFAKQALLESRTAADAAALIL